MEYEGLTGEAESSAFYSYTNEEDNCSTDDNTSVGGTMVTPNGGGLAMASVPYDFFGVASQQKFNGPDTRAGVRDAEALEDFLDFLGSDVSSSVSFQDNSIFDLPAATAANSQSGVDYDVMDFVDGQSAGQTATARRGDQRPNASETAIAAGLGATMGQSYTAVPQRASATTHRAAGGASAFPGLKRKASQQDISENYDPFKDFGYSHTTGLTASNVCSANNRVTNGSSSGAGSRANEDDGFVFGIETYLHGYQLGFGRQPSFKRVAADSLPKKDYLYYLGIPEDSSTVAPPSATIRGRSRPLPDAANDGAGENSPRITTTEALRTWFDTYPGSPLAAPSGTFATSTRLPPRTSVFSPASEVPTNAARSRADSNAINEDFRREIDLMVRNLMAAGPDRVAGKGANGAVPQSRASAAAGEGGGSDLVGPGDGTVPAREFVGFSGSAAFPRAPLAPSTNATAPRPVAITREPVKTIRSLGAGGPVGPVTRTPVNSGRSPAAMVEGSQLTPGGGRVTYNTPANGSASSKSTAETPPGAATPGKRRQTWGNYKQQQQPSGATPPHKLTDSKRGTTSSPAVSGQTPAKCGTGTPSAGNRGGGDGGKANSANNTGSTHNNGDPYQYWDDAWLHAEGSSSKAPTPAGPKVTREATLPSLLQESESLMANWADAVGGKEGDSTTPAAPAPAPGGSVPSTKAWKGSANNGMNAAPVETHHRSLTGDRDSAASGMISPSTPAKQITRATPGVTKSPSSVPRSATAKAAGMTGSSSTVSSTSSGATGSRISASTGSGRLPRLSRPPGSRPTSTANCASAVVAPVVPLYGHYASNTALRNREASGPPPTGSTSTSFMATTTLPPTHKPVTGTRQQQQQQQQPHTKGGPLLQPLPSWMEPEKRASLGSPPRPAAAGGIRHPTPPTSATDSATGRRPTLPRTTTTTATSSTPTSAASTTAVRKDTGTGPAKRNAAEDTDAHIDYLLQSMDYQSQWPSTNAPPSSFPKPPPPTSSCASLSKPATTQNTAAPPTLNSAGGAGLSSDLTVSPGRAMSPVNTSLQWASKRPTSILQAKATTPTNSPSNPHRSPLPEAKSDEHQPSATAAGAGGAGVTRSIDELVRINNRRNPRNGDTAAGAGLGERQHSTGGGDGSVPVTPSAVHRRRLSEFKTGGYWYPSFSKSKGSLPDPANTTTANAAGERDREEVEREVQRANEERKERIRAYMLRRKAEKEKQAQQKRLAEEDVEAKRRRHSENLALNTGGTKHAATSSDTSTTEEAAPGGAARGRKQQPSMKRKHQPRPAVPYLPTTSHTTATLEEEGGRSTAPRSANRETNVRTVVLYVPSTDDAGGEGDQDNSTRSAGNNDNTDKNANGKNALCGSVNVALREQRTLEVQHRLEPPRFFKVDEYLTYAGESQLRLPSSVLLELNRRFLSGMNGAVLLASTKNARQASASGLRHVVESVVMHLPPRSEVFLSMALVRNGCTEDLLLLNSVPAGTPPRQESVAFKAMPLVGMTLDGVGFVKITGTAQADKLLATGYSYAEPRLSAEQPNAGMIVMVLVLKQLALDGDVVLSSLLVTDVGTHVRSYNAVMQRAEGSPYQMFHGALGGPSFTVALFSVSAAGDAGTVPLLNTQFKLGTIANRQTHIGSIRRFVELVSNELRSQEENTPGAGSSKFRKLKEQLVLGKAVLEDPVSYKPGDTPEHIAQKQKLRPSPAAIGSNSPATLPRPIGHRSGTGDSAGAASDTVPPETGGRAPPRESASTRTPPLHHQHATSSSSTKRDPKYSLFSGGLDANPVGSSQTSSTAAPAANSTTLNGDNDERVAGVAGKSGPAPSLPKNPGKLPVFPASPKRRATPTPELPLTPTRASQRRDGGTAAASAVEGGRGSSNAISSLAPPTGSGSGRYTNRTQKPGNARTFIQLDDDDSVVTPSEPPPPPPPQQNVTAASRSTPPKTPSEPARRSSVSGRFLPGAATIGANGPSWPSAPNLQPPAPPEVAPGRSREDVFTVDSSASSRAGVHMSLRDDAPGGVPQSMIPPSTKVRTLVLIDPRCRETSNVTYDNYVLITTGEDDFEEYEVDEVSEVAPKNQFIVSDVLQELCNTVLMGCNAAILTADSRSYTVSAMVLKSVVRTILQSIADGGGSHFGSLSASVVKLKGETVVDLLGPGASEPQKLVIAISPIFGSCVHGVEYRPVTDVGAFETMLTDALTRASENGRDPGLVFASLILKLKVPDQDDVVVCSLVASFAGENVGLYTSVLERSPLVPRALYHYALGGPCYTVALLGIGGDETRANQMLQVQHRLGEISNRPTHPGSIVKFIQGIRQDLQPALTEKLHHAEDAEERATTNAILNRLQEMVRDAEVLLDDFENHEPKAYLHESEEAASNAPSPNHKRVSSPSASSAGAQQPPLGADRAKGGEGKRRALPQMTLKDEPVQDEESLRVKSLVCFEQRLLGGGALATQGNSILVSTAEGGKRFDSDEVILRDGENVYIPDSKLIDELVLKFASGHNTGLLASDSGNCAFTPLVLRKIVYQVIGAMQAGDSDGERLVRALGGRVIKGELQVSMSLVKDNITADLLPVEADAPYHDFEIEHSFVFGPRITGVTSHFVNTAEDFDRYLAVAIDNADPALQTDDPGIMVVSLTLTQQLDNDDVYVSALLCSAVFDAVHHYFNVLDRNPLEPLELFRNILSGASYSVAMTGISDADNDSVNLLNALAALSRVVNRPTQPNSMVKHIHELQDVIAKLAEHAATSSSTEDKNYNMKRMEVVQWMLQNAEALKRNPLTQHQVQQGRRTFVPLGAPEMTSGSAGSHSRFV